MVVMVPFIGQVLTAEAINKTAFLISSLAYNGIELEMVAPATYDPANGILYFPHQIAVTEATVLDGLPPKAATLTVTNASSNQFDQLSYLWETVNSKNMITVATKPILPIMKFLTAPPSLLPCRNHNLLWNTGSLPNGIYFVRISTSGSGMISKKVVIL